MTVDIPRPAPLRSLVVPAIATALAGLVLVGLGLWQLQRLDWKTRLIDTIAARTTAPPEPLPAEADWAGLTQDVYAYRHVVLTGTFEHGGEAYVFRPLAEAKGPAHGIGYLVLTPLRLASGAHVIVNRGFVPAEKRDPATRRPGQVGGETTITGLMREPETRNWFTPADDPAQRLWYTRDPASIAAALRLEHAAPFVIDQDAWPVPGGLPQGGETLLAIPNNHLSYALTWFGLALGLAAVFAASVIRALRGRAGAR